MFGYTLKPSPKSLQVIYLIGDVIPITAYIAAATPKKQVLCLKVMAVVKAPDV
jgi:hypothetical protein